MIKINRSKLIQALRQVSMQNEKSHKDLVDDLLERDGKVALSFLVKRNLVSVPDSVIETELDQMVERSLINIEQHEQMCNLLFHSSGGNKRVMQFFKKQKRFLIIN